MSHPCRKVVVVEDSALQRRHVVELCRALGIERVREAGDGLEALELLDTLQTAPDLMLVDLEMPRMDGVEFLQALQARSLAVPVALVSSRDTALMEALQAMGCGVVACLPKPLTREALEDLLTRHRPSPVVPAAERRQAGRIPFTAAMLAEAIRHGGIVPHFQPKIDLRTGLLRGVATLARWQHPSFGWVPPDQFVAAAERTGLIGELTLSIMDQAFARGAHWSDRGLHVSVAVNLSPCVLGRPDIVGEIESLAVRRGLAPEQIVLEVTEGSIVSATGRAPAALARLRLKGFGLSIDDYGTGFSSLQQLGRIPFTEMKIDRSFVDGAHARKSLRVILESAIALARQLDLVTVAEGVETLEDWRLLQRSGCLCGQGWLIAKAMPGEELPGWLRANKARLNGLRITQDALG